MTATLMATKMETVSQSHCESGAKADQTLAALTDGRTSKSDSSSDDERLAKTGSNNSQQNNMSSSQSQKRPMNAFLIFCKRHRSVVRQKYPHLENRSITKILGEWWAALDSDQKLKYTELARQYKEAFMKANPHFKWYKTTDLRPPIAPPSPPPPPPPPVAPVVVAQTPTQPPPQQTQTQSTPKPPKKRYLENLENGEFKAANNANHNNVIKNMGTSGGQSSTTSTPVKCTNAGPPILDIETANRVIENALSGSLSANLTSNAMPTTREKSAFNSEIINGHINSVLEQHSIETRELEALERSSHNKWHSNAGASSSNPTNSTTNSADKSATNSISKPVSSPTPMPSEDEELEEENNEDEDKPLNLSASTVLHTSNQHIIDHFIDKLLSTGTEGTSSASGLSLPFSSPSFSSMSFNTSSGDDNKSNNNYNKNSNNNRNQNNINNNNNSINDNTNCNSLSTNTNTGNSAHNQNRAQSRKDRSCKGKRYLEILNENKCLGKRSRTVSSISTNSEKDETSAKNLSSKEQSGSGCGSKWVSGGFDLEERIAQLPQLGDTHLLNALSHSKANKTISSSNKNGCNDGNEDNHSNHSKPLNVINNCSVNESNDSPLSDRSSDNEDNDIIVENRDSNQLNDNTLKHYTRDANVGKNADNINEQSVSKIRQNSDQTPEDSINDKTDETISSNPSDLVNSLPTTQGIEFSDGLAALAEVALQQQRNTV